MGDFATTLRGLRERAGHGSARAFYRARGGLRGFGCTYKAYLNIESGRSLPQPGLALKIAAALGADAGSPQARSFIASYLRGVLGREELADFVLRVLSAGAKAKPPSLLERAADNSFKQMSVPLTIEQAETMVSSADCYWCFSILENDYGRWTPAEIAKRVGISSSRARAALETLARAGLAARDRAGRYSSPFTGKVLVYPRDRFFVPRYRAKLKTYWLAMAQRKGGLLFHRHLLVRASESRLRDEFSRIAQSVSGAHVYAAYDPGPDTAFFALEASVRSMVPL